MTSISVVLVVGFSLPEGTAPPHLSCGDNNGGLSGQKSWLSVQPSTRTVLKRAVPRHTLTPNMEKHALFGQLIVRIVTIAVVSRHSFNITMQQVLHYGMHGDAKAISKFPLGLGPTYDARRQR